MSIISSSIKNSDLAKGTQPDEQEKKNEQRLKTVTPDNDNGTPGEPVEAASTGKNTNTHEADSSNKGKGPLGEDL